MVASNYPKLFLTMLLTLSFFFLLGCVSDSIPVPPVTQSQILAKTTCLTTPQDINNYLQGDYNNMVIIVDGNRLCFASASDLNVSVDLSGYVSWVDGNNTYAFKSQVDDLNNLLIDLTQDVNVWGDARYVPLDRNITINGVTYDLSQDRSWTIATTDTNLETYGVFRTDTNSLYNLGDVNADLFKGRIFWSDLNNNYGTCYMSDGNIIVGYLTGWTCS